MVEKLLNTKIAITNKPARIGEQLRTKAIIDKASKLLNYEPVVELMEGVQEQIQNYRNKI